jgi:hypothetical protein
MNAEGSARAGSRREQLGFFGLISTFWGLAVLLLLAGYSFEHAVHPEPAATGTRSAAVEAHHESAAFASFVPPASYPEVERVPPILSLICNADDVRTGGSLGAGRYLITMRFDQVPDDIRALLNGTDTVFPKDALISMSPCIRGMIDRGELP